MAVRLKLNSARSRDLLRSDPIREDLLRRAHNIAQRAGRGFSADSEPGKNRARATVWTDTPEAMVAEAQHRTLTRALDAGRH